MFKPCMDDEAERSATAAFLVLKTTWSRRLKYSMIGIGAMCRQACYVHTLTSALWTKEREREREAFTAGRIAFAFSDEFDTFGEPGTAGEVVAFFEGYDK